MGKKRRIITKHKKFGRKFASHPAAAKLPKAKEEPVLVSKPEPKPEPIVEAPAPKVEPKPEPVLYVAPEPEPTPEPVVEEKPALEEPKEDKPKKKKRRSFTSRLNTTKPSDD